jgi:hypothetical protein
VEAVKFNPWKSGTFRLPASDAQRTPELTSSSSSSLSLWMKEGGRERASERAGEKEKESAHIDGRTDMRVCAWTERADKVCGGLLGGGRENE